MRLRGAPKPRYRPGERVQYDCRLGFKPIVPLRSRSAVCEDDNTWSALEEACTSKETLFFYYCLESFTPFSACIHLLQ